MNIWKTFSKQIGPSCASASFFFLFCVDMWAMGAIISELLTLQPLFPGTRYSFAIHVNSGLLPEY